MANEQKKINIRNKRATFDYEIIEEFVAGVVLVAVGLAYRGLVLAARR